MARVPINKNLKVAKDELEFPYPEVRSQPVSLPGTHLNTVIQHLTPRWRYEFRRIDAKTLLVIATLTELGRQFDVSTAQLQELENFDRQLQAAKFLRAPIPDLGTEFEVPS